MLHGPRTHGSLQPFDADLVLERDRKSMKWANNLSSRFQLFVKPSGTLEGAVNENFRETIGLRGENLSTAVSSGGILMDTQAVER